MILLILADLDNAIAKDGKQITFIPEDLARFKARTTGQVILMGRKTLENAGKLPHRITGVMTRKNLPDEEDVFYFSSEEELDEKLEAYARGRNAKAVIILPPTPEIVDDDLFVGMNMIVSLQEKMKELNQKAQGLHLDSVIPKDPALYIDGIHLMPEGHEMIARAVYDYGKANAIF